jgi:SAM-dependent methyltransferase
VADRLQYGALNLPVLSAIPLTARRLLDLGCGTGALGREIKARQPAEVIGVTYSPEEAELACGFLNHVLVRDLNVLEPTVLGQFDCIVCSHVLEHLCWPGRLLRMLLPHLEPEGRLIVALPNLLVWRQRVQLMLGRFRYTDGGVMDRTHFRFFDWGTARELVEGAGFQVLSATADGGFPLARFLPGLGPVLSRLSLRLCPGLFGWQFLLVARPRPAPDVACDFSGVELPTRPPSLLPR